MAGPPAEPGGAPPAAHEKQTEQNRESQWAAQAPGTVALAMLGAREIAARGPAPRAPGEAGRLPLPRRGRRRPLHRQGEVAAGARAHVLPGRRDARLGTSQLVERVADVEAIVTGTEVEALHLEQNLVKRHRPPFNVRLRDDKSFPYIAVTVDDEFPRVMFTRERHRRGVVYFGPYANAKKVRETLDVLNRVFKFRPCEGPKPGRHSGIPCLDYHIDRCLAPCVGYVSAEEYATVIDGDRPLPLRATRARSSASSRSEMREAAAEERFEDAARYRNRLSSIRHLAERQAADQRTVGTVDVIGIAVDGDRAAVQIFPLRDGKMVDRYGFQLENVEGQDVLTLARGVLPRVLRGGTERPPPDRRPARRRRLGSAGRVPVGAARLAGRGAQPRTRREAAPRRARRAERPARARVGGGRWPSAGACAAWTRSRSCARA